MRRDRPQPGYRVCGTAVGRKRGDVTPAQRLQVPAGVRGLRRGYSPGDWPEGCTMSAQGRFAAAAVAFVQSGCQDRDKKPGLEPAISEPLTLRFSWACHSDRFFYPLMGK
jgi:hypothetical protein